MSVKHVTFRARGPAVLSLFARHRPLLQSLDNDVRSCTRVRERGADENKSFTHPYECVTSALKIAIQHDDATATTATTTTTTTIQRRQVLHGRVRCTGATMRLHLEYGPTVTVVRISAADPLPRRRRHRRGRSDVHFLPRAVHQHRNGVAAVWCNKSVGGSGETERATCSLVPFSYVYIIVTDRVL